MSTPHDALFKQTFSDPRHAEGLLRAVLPSALASRVAWASLAAVPGSFVDPQLAQRHTDLLFRADFAGRSAFLYVLVEHQSTPDPLMAYRLAAYLVRIWERWLAEQPGKPRALPAIVPVVVHHGVAALVSVMRYILRVHPDQPESVLGALRQAIPDESVKETIMTAGEELMRRGEARGEARGRLLGQRTLLQKMLTLRFGPLPEGVLTRLEAADAPTLDAWAERVLTAASVDEVFG